MMAEVDAHEVELFLQVEMVVHHDALVVFIGQQCEQSLAEYGLAVWLAQVKNVKTLFE